MGADTRSVQVFGKKKTATAVASCKAGRGLVKVNGVPIELLRPEVLRTKVMEPFYILGENVFNQVDIRIRVKGGGQLPKFMLFVKQSQKLLLHTIKNLLMKQQRKRSRKNLFNLTVLSWLLIQDVQNQRNWWTWCSCKIPKILS